MFKIFNFFKKYYLWFLLVILTIPAFYSLIRPGFFYMQDDLQAFRIHQMDKCIQDLQIPCRWVPDAGYQYGYPQFNFYPPSVYYLGETFHLLGLQFIDSVKLLFILGFITSTLTMFLLLKTVFGSWPGFVGSVLYTYIPYKAVEVYVRGAMSEFWALAIFPLIFWSSYQLVKKGHHKYIGFLAISVGLLLTTHNLMSLIFLPLAALWSITLVILDKKWISMSHLVLGFLLGLGLASFFTLPVVLERQYAHLESLLGGYFDYRRHFVDINQLFLSNHWGYGSSELGKVDDLSLSTGIVQWVASLAAIVFAILNLKKHRKVSVLVLVVGILELATLFMIHQKSSFIWAMLPFLSFLQFPWRFLADSIFLLSFLAASSVYFLEKFETSGKIKIIGPALFGTLLMILAFFSTFNFFKPSEWFNISDREKFSGISWEKQLTISIFDYLPIYAELPPAKKAPEFPQTLSGRVEYLRYQKGSNYQIYEVNVLEDAKIRLPLFDFPGMKVSMGGKEIAHGHNDCYGEEYCLGLISFHIPTGKHTIAAKLFDTPVRTIGNFLTIISVLGVIIIFCKNYYVKRLY